MQIKWKKNINFKVLDRMLWNKEYYKLSSYLSFDTNKIIKEASRTLTAIRVEDIHLMISISKNNYYNIVLIIILYYSVLFTNLILDNFF